MIKLTRPAKPKFLCDNGISCTENLLKAVNKYGGYKCIPKGEKEELIKHYRHDEIKKTLFSSSNEKCAFCESTPGDSGYLEVEHFHPKSIYPEETFKWENFLPSCKRCNIPKGDFDTKTNPIINPYDIDPKDYFQYNCLKIIPKENCPDKILANTTIKTCDLNSTRLLKPRADLLLALSEYENSLLRHLNSIDEADTDRKKTLRINDLLESLEIIEQFIDPKKNYSSFCKNYLENSDIFIRSKKIVTVFLNGI